MNREKFYETDGWTVIYSFFLIHLESGHEFHIFFKYGVCKSMQVDRLKSRQTSNKKQTFNTQLEKLSQ